MEKEAIRRKTAVVTASYSGIGSEFSKLLALDGIDLILMNRDNARTMHQIRELNSLAPTISIWSVITDLSNHESIRNAARQISEDHERIDLLINNAGILLDQMQMSPQGNEIHYEVNTIAPYLLTRLLRPQLAAAGRSIVVVVGSSAMKMARTLEIPTLRTPRTSKTFGLYARSKLAITSAFFALAEDFAKDGIWLRVVDPGVNKTPMATSASLPFPFKLFRKFFASPDVGAKRIYDAVFDRNFGEQTGIYIEKGKVSRPPVAVTRIETQTALLNFINSNIDQAAK